MSASMNSIAWSSTIGRPNCTRSFGEREREVERAGRRADRASADHDALLDEPVLRELEPLARPRRAPRPSPTPHVLEREDRVLEHERVRVLRRPDERARPGRSLSTRNTVAFVGSPSTCACTRKKSATSPEVTCHFVAVRAPSRRRRGRAVVSTIDGSEPAPLLGDRVGVAALAAARGAQVARPSAPRSPTGAAGSTDATGCPTARRSPCPTPPRSASAGTGRTPGRRRRPRG